MTRQRIVIVGGGFAGLTAARQLSTAHQVTLVDRSAWFEWLPNIHELLSAHKRPAELRLPLGTLVRRAGHRYVRASVERIDARVGRVVTADGRELPFDACIVAVGGVDEPRGVRGAARHALPFKSVEACATIGRRLAALARSRGSRSVVIVGGGLEGVEALGEILRLRKRHAGLDVTLVEGGRRLLPGAPKSVDAAIRAHCRRLGVRLVTGSRVTTVTARSVRLDNGESLRADLAIWTGGVVASPLLRSSRLAQGRGWAPVRATLQSERHPNVFVAGDAAALPKPLAKQAYYAIQMGELAAANVERWLAGRRLVEFSPSRKPMLIAFGDLDTFLVAGRSAVATPALAAAKELVFQATMARFDPPLQRQPLQRLSRRVAGLRELGR